MRRSGLSIDWRRKFVSIDPEFSKFIEWQFGILNANHLLVQGKHPVGWCPNEGNPVGMHDTKGGVEPEIEKEVAIKFKVVGEEAYNLWLHIGQKRYLVLQTYLLMRMLFMLSAR